VPLKDILHEMNAFLDGQESRLASLLSSASTGQINELNQHLPGLIGNSGHLLDLVDLPLASAASPDATPGSSGGYEFSEVFGGARDTIGPASAESENDWSALSWSDLCAMKTQIDQQLNTVRTEFQAFLGPLTDDMVSEAAAEFDSLSIAELISGAKNNTNSLMEQLSAQQGSESSLVDDVLFSMTHLMDADSLVTADDALEGLMEAFQLESLATGAYLPPLSEAARSAPQSYEDAENSSHRPETERLDASASADTVLVDQVQSIAPVIDIDPAGHLSLSTVSNANPESGLSGSLRTEGLFMPLSAAAGPDAGNPESGVTFDKSTYS